MGAKQPRIVRKVKLDGKWVFAALAVKNGRPNPSRIIYKGNTLSSPPGTFYLDFHEPLAGGGSIRRRTAIGDDPAAIGRALTTQQHVLELRRRGVDADDAPEITGNRRAAGDTLITIARNFSEAPPARLARKSAAKYSSVLREFAAWASRSGATHPSLVNARTLEKWMKKLRDQDGLDARTVVDKVIIVTVELRKHGAVIDLKSQDLPKVTERQREIYEPELLKPLFAAAGPREYALYMTFLLSGMREQEVAFLFWDDVDVKRSTLRVRRKPDLGFELKNYQERTIGVPRMLIELLLQHKERAGLQAGLVFPTELSNGKRGALGGRRDKKMLAKLKGLAKRSGLNCGHCIGTHNNKPVTCATHPICDKFGLHKFRHTYATTLLRDGLDIISLQKQLGHKDLDSTRKYVRALDQDELQAKVESSSLATRFV
jgi:integrase/recombinase XerD